MKPPRPPSEMHSAEMELWVTVVLACVAILLSALVNRSQVAALYGLSAILFVCSVLVSTPCRDRRREDQ